MAGFTFRSVLMDQGKKVALIVYRGSQATANTQLEELGALTFARDEWEAFRRVLIAGIRAGGFLHIPIDFSDQTRREPVIMAGQYHRSQ